MNKQPSRVNRSKVIVCVEIEPELADRISRMREANGCSKSWIHNMALRQFLDSKGIQ